MTLSLVLVLVVMVYLHGEHGSLRVTDFLHTRKDFPPPTRWVWSVLLNITPSGVLGRWKPSPGGDVHRNPLQQNTVYGRMM